MRLIKPRGFLIGEKKFQLIGKDKVKSKTLNLKQNSKKELSTRSKNALEDGICREWGTEHYGTANCISKGFAQLSHDRFINLMNQNPIKKKEILIVGPALGFEAENISKKVKGAKISTFDIVDEITEQHKKYITRNGVYVDKGGIENYQNKDLIGKFDGITAMYSAGFHVNFNNLDRNILKMAMMLKPGGIAVIKLKSGYLTSVEENFIPLLKKLKLDTQFEIKYPLTDSTHPDIIIKRK